MTNVVADISMSLDGFVTGPRPDLEHGLGDGGAPLHTWAMDSSDDVDAAVLRETVKATGAVVMGRRLFDFVDGPHGWNDERAYGAGLAALLRRPSSSSRTPGRATSSLTCPSRS